MEPRELLQALLDRDGENSHSLAVKLKSRGGPSQPQIHKFLKGVAKEPRRSTLQPLADHFHVPIDAFYDAGLAQRVASELGLLGGTAPRAAEAPAPYTTTIRELTMQQLQLLEDLEELAPSRASKFIDAIHEAAEEAREIARHQETRRGKVAAARRTAAPVAATAVTWGDGNERQTSLPLSTVRDPFTAAPGERESELYRRIEKAPKK